MTLILVAIGLAILTVWLTHDVQNYLEQRDAIKHWED